MNKRQKLVQERFLDNEEAVIKELKAVYKDSLETIDKNIKELEELINENWVNYAFETDPETKEVFESMMQSKVYQKQYQEALKKQVSAVLDNLQTEEFKTISDYMRRCYDDGYIGTMFDFAGQGIPVLAPMDAAAIVRAVQLDSKLSDGLYARLGEDVKALKTKISAQVARGISTGKSHADIARQIAAETNIGYNNAVRIARTEGHRIQIQSTMDAGEAAKEKGADVLKQWDSTLDGATRKAHKKVDGEIREMDEPFSNGLMFPGDPGGGASEVVNCRCALLQRARWALDEKELETLRERAKFFDIDKEDNFDEFKKKYLNATEVETITIQTAQTFEQLSAALKRDHGIQINDSVKQLDIEAVKEALAGIEKFESAAPHLKGKLVDSIDTYEQGYMTAIGKTINFNPKYFKTYTKAAESTKHSIEADFVHEIGHCFEESVAKANGLNRWDSEDWTTSGKDIIKAANRIVKAKTGTAGKLGDISRYAGTDAHEAIAEAVRIFVCDPKVAKRKPMVEAIWEVLINATK